MRFVEDDRPAEEIAEERRSSGALADAVRRLVDVTVRTTVAPSEVDAVAAEVERLTARLEAEAYDGSYGIRYSRDGDVRPWGNAVVGLRNPVAPPLVVHQDPSGRAWSDFHLGAAYEGPPGLVHGGVTALLLDQLLGEACGAGKRSGMTANLSLTYRKPTRLGDLHGEARIDRIDGIKTWASGAISDADGVCVEAEGLFILPRWARERMAREHAERPQRFE